MERKGISIKGRDLLPKDLLDDLEKEADVKKKVRDFLDGPYLDAAALEESMRQRFSGPGVFGSVGGPGISGMSGYVGSSGFSGSGETFMTPNELREMNGLGRLAPGLPGAIIRRRS